MRYRFFTGLISLSWILASCDHSTPSTSTESTSVDPLSLQSSMVEIESVPKTRLLSGTLHPKDHALIAAKMMGWIDEIFVHVGQPVEKGDLLLQLKSEEFAARLKQAQALLAQTERDLHREQILLSKGATTTDRVERLENQRVIHQAQLEEASVILEYTRIKAPFSGVITAEFLKAGDLASPGAPILDLEGVDRLQLEIDVPASLPIPPLGSSIQIDPSTSIHGKIVEIAPARDFKTRTRLVKLELPPDAPFQSGQFIPVQWPIGSEQQIRIPRSARVLTGQIESVWILQENQAKRVIIQTDESSENATLQVLSGLHSGDILILNPPAYLVEGQSVRSDQ